MIATVCVVRGDSYRFFIHQTLISSRQAIFAIVGKVAMQEWVEEATVFVPVEAEEMDDDDLDFESL